MNLWRWSALLGGTVIGSALIGAGVAILFMPQAGPETRRQIRRFGNDSQAWLQDQLHLVADLAQGPEHAHRVGAHASGEAIAVEH